MSRFSGSYYLKNNETGAGQPFRVVRVKTMELLVPYGIETYEDAVSKAKALAAEYPGEEFTVIGPLTTARASIPVETHDVHHGPSTMFTGSRPAPAAQE